MNKYTTIAARVIKKTPMNSSPAYSKKEPNSPGPFPTENPLPQVIKASPRLDKRIVNNGFQALFTGRCGARRGSGGGVQFAGSWLMVANP
jgi:hypothetical protein